MHFIGDEGGRFTSSLSFAANFDLGGIRDSVQNTRSIHCLKYIRLIG
jgi:hypothetical protein